MSVDLKDPEVDDTPEYPLPSPTDPLARDQFPPEDDVGEDGASSDEVKEGDLDANKN